MRPYFLFQHHQIDFPRLLIPARKVHLQFNHGTSHSCPSNSIYQLFLYRRVGIDVFYVPAVVDGDGWIDEIPQCQSRKISPPPAPSSLSAVANYSRLTKVLLSAPANSSQTVSSTVNNSYVRRPTFLTLF